MAMSSKETDEKMRLARQKKAGTAAVTSASKVGSTPSSEPIIQAPASTTPAAPAPTQVPVTSAPQPKTSDVQPSPPAEIPNAGDPEAKKTEKFNRSQLADQQEGAAVGTPPADVPKLSEEEQNKLNEQLLEAVGSCDKNAMADLISKGADVNAKANNGWTALMLAAQYGETETAKLLITKGADVNVKNNYGETALMSAAQYGKTETAKLLIANKADVEAKNENGWTALMYAARNGNTETAEMLIAKGADVEAKDKDGRTALDIARENNKTEVVELLEKRMGLPASTTPAATAPAQVPVTSAPQPKAPDVQASGTAEADSPITTGSLQRIKEDKFEHTFYQMNRPLKLGNTGLTLTWTGTLTSQIEKFQVIGKKGEKVSPDVAFLKLGDQGTIEVGKKTVIVKYTNSQANRKTVSITVATPVVDEPESEKADQQASYVSMVKAYAGRIGAAVRDGMAAIAAKAGAIAAVGGYMGRLKVYPARVLAGARDAAANTNVADYLKEYKDPITAFACSTAIATASLVVPGLAEALGTLAVPLIALLYVVPLGLAGRSFYERGKELEKKNT